MNYEYIIVGFIVGAISIAIGYYGMEAMFAFIKRLFSTKRECICCKFVFSLSALKPNICLGCRILTAHCPNFLSLTPAAFIKKMIDDEAVITQTRVKLNETEKDRKDAVLLHSKEALDWMTARDGYVATATRQSNEIQGLQVTIQQREVQIRGLETKVKQIEKGLDERVATEARLNEEIKSLNGTIRSRELHDEEVRLPLIETLRKEVSEFKALADHRGETVARLLLGKFTVQELQDLCHHLDEGDYKAFVDGCAIYQKQVFGKCDREELHTKVFKLQDEVNALKNLLRRWKEFAANLELNSNSLGVATKHVLDLPKIGQMAKLTGDGQEITLTGEYAPGIHNLLDLAKAGGKMKPSIGDQLNSDGD